ncbi:MAG: GNAT family N-acetyltransferase [Sphaerochaetaceae bacterium]
MSQKQYDLSNRPDHLNDMVLVYEDTLPVACGAFKKYDESTVEIKRILVRKEYRHQGISKSILRELEGTAREAGYTYAVLETGKKQFEAIGLSTSEGYEMQQNYGPYARKENSICMRKAL